MLTRCEHCKQVRLNFPELLRHGLLLLWFRGTARYLTLGQVNSDHTRVIWVVLLEKKPALENELISGLKWNFPFVILEGEGKLMFYYNPIPVSSVQTLLAVLQMLEIASLTEHLLTDCDKRDSFGKCSRCREAVPRDELPRHIKSRICHRE